MLKKLLSILLFLPQLLMAAEFIEGKDYQLIAKPEPLVNRRKPVVTEFFSYGCPGCYKIEPQLDSWKAAYGDQIELTRVAVIFQPEWLLYAKAYYTAKILALNNKLSPLLFKTIQEKRQSLAKQDAMINFFVAQGIDRAIISNAFLHSATIESAVSKGLTTMANYQITAIPAFVVNNRYKTDLSMAGNAERLFAVINFLLKKPA